MEVATIPPVMNNRSIPDTPRKRWCPNSSRPISAEGIWQTLSPTQQRNVLDTLVRLCCRLTHPDRRVAIEKERDHDSC